MDETSGGQAQRDAVNLYLARLRGAFERPKPKSLVVPEEPACEIPDSKSAAFAYGWRLGWIAGKFSED